jgi:Tol biopolymer transport system component
MHAHLRLLSALLLSSMLIGCSGNPGPPGQSVSGPQGSASNSCQRGAALTKPVDNGPSPLLAGRLIETEETSLEEWTGGRRLTIACSPGASSYFEYPAFSPDGRSIAYVLATTPTSQGQDWGNDVYLANVDGTGARLVFKHDMPGALIDALSWTPDGTGLIVGYNRAVFDSQGRYLNSILRVDRIVIATGASSTLLSNASQPSPSWDGKRLVYVSFPSPDLRASALAMANIDGGDAHQILQTMGGFQAFFAPHLSPDGKRLVFAAVGGPLPASPTPQGRYAPLPEALRRLMAQVRDWSRAQPAQADGSPYQVWVVNLDGTDPHPIANLREDLPFPLWSSDGHSILFLGGAALYYASADGSDVKRIDHGVAHGEIAWYQP